MSLTVEQARAYLEDHRVKASALIDVASQAGSIFEARNDEQGVRVVNVQVFTALFTLDLACLLDDILEEQEYYRRRFYSRQLILIMVEAAQKLRSLAGKQFYADLSDAAAPASLLSQARAAHKAISKLHDAMTNSYGDIRNGLAAHRDVSALEQLRLIGKIDPETVLRDGKMLLPPLQEISACAKEFYLLRLERLRGKPSDPDGIV